MAVQEGSHRSAHAINAEKLLFVGSAVKTFILAQYLREVEAGRLSESTQVSVGPEVWSPGSAVFIHLQGTTPARWSSPGGAPVSASS